jgi:phospholipid/cholesterol/gamma-HCH transport system substrate-binding protein
MKRSRLDLAVGVFVLVGLLAFGWLSVKLGRVDLFGAASYQVTAVFPSAGGLKVGSSVEIAGVDVGKVTRIRLADYQAHVVLQIDQSVQIQEDAIASIKTKGLIGERFIRISPGGSDRLIPPGGRLTEVEPPVDFEELLSKFIFGKV